MSKLYDVSRRTLKFPRTSIGVSLASSTGTSFLGSSAYGTAASHCLGYAADRTHRLFAFIDRSNAGNAKIDGLTTDLHLDGNKFNIALVVFYIPYILVDVPANWLVKRVKANIFLPTLITGWGLVSTFLGFTKSFGGLIAARLVLGLMEGGLLGGMIVYLAMFYRRHQMLYRVGLFYCAAPLSGAFGGLLATGLAKIRYNGYNNWPWIFFGKSSA